MANYVLSYILGTRNKLVFLRQVLRRLVRERRSDEEIVVVDGASSDGTADYLRQLSGKGLIDQFISEPDYGEAHAYNKAVLLSRGALIKTMTDDDVFYHPGIQRCKDFMVGHPEVDVLGTEGASITVWQRRESIAATRYREGYKMWQASRKPFEFSGLGLMIRRSSLPLVGLFVTGRMRWVDPEFEWRLTSGPANLAWLTHPTYVRILNEQSGAQVFKNELYLDMLRLEQFYGRRSLSNTVRLLLAPARPWLRRAARRVRRRSPMRTPAAAEIDQLFESCQAWLAQENARAPGQFLTKNTDTPCEEHTAV